MKLSGPLERQVAPLVLAALAGDASDADWRRLEELLQGSPAALELAADIAGQEALLMLGGHAAATRNAQPADSTPAAADLVESLDSPEPLANLAMAGSLLREDLADLHGRRSARGGSAAGGLAKLALAFATGLAAALAGVYVLWAIKGLPVAPGGEAWVAAKAPYTARLVSNNNCLWDPVASGSFALGQEIGGGQALNLIEGLAEFELRWPAGGHGAVRMEGPASLVLAADGVPILQFGKLTLAIERASGQIALETPLGRVEIHGPCRLGVSAFGTEVQIHFFEGEGAFESPWLATSEQEIDQLRIRAGEAILLKANHGGELALERRLADQDAFVDQVSMAADALIVPRRYVDAVIEERPLGYWRFESDESATVLNEMGPSLPCRLMGSAKLFGQEGSRGLSLGPEPTPRGAAIDGSFGALLGDSYALEAWIKPSHFHGGTILSLIGAQEGDSMYFPHGIAVELGGHGKVPTAARHPGRLRYLHRNPMSHDPDLGTSCFSNEPYAMRRWQHLVAVKNGAIMTLYVNGRVVGTADDASTAPPDLSLVIGRLYPLDGNEYPHFHVRPYVGQLDELAIYPRALSESEIRAHYRLLRPKDATEPSI